MKNVKRRIATILSLAIVMTGICWCEKPVKEVQAATETEANTEMLELKFQRGITDETINKIRVVASVDSPNYSAVGFGIDKGDGNGETLFTINTKQYPLPQKIKSSVTGMEYAFNPKVVDTSSEYFLTAKWTAVENTKYTVRAWVKTFDGEMVFGQSRCIELADLSTTEYLNMSFELKAGCELTKSAEDETKYGDIVVAYNGTSTTAEVISVKTNENGGQTVHVNVRNVNRTALPSVTEFVFKDSEGAELGNNSFRNLYKSYTGTSDTTWYDANETEFVIATTADLYGFAALVNGTAGVGDPVDFEKKTIYLASDITINKGWNPTINQTTGVLSGDAPQYSWTPIAMASGNAFAGTFDGKNNEIDGVYLVRQDETNNYYGLFGAIESGATVKNFKLTNSYFECKTGWLSKGTYYALMGSISGDMRGTLENVYSSAIVINHNAQQAGGLVGRLNDTNDVANKENGRDAVITKCWFDGKLYLKDSAARCGGIAGVTLLNDSYIENCLFTGLVEYTGTGTSPNMGGILGKDHSAGNIHITSCLALGTVEGKNDGKAVNTSGSVAGNISASGTNFIVTNVYAGSKCFKKNGTVNQTAYGNLGTSATNNISGNKKYGIIDETMISGASAANRQVLVNFDFENTWATITTSDGVSEDGKPVLKYFKDWYVSNVLLKK